MSSNQLIYEMSNQPLDIPEQKIGMEFGSIKTETSFHQQFHSCPVVEELPMAPTASAESSFEPLLDTLEVPPSQPDANVAATEDVLENQQKHPKKKVLPVKPCVVLLKRSRVRYF